jgi:hypothetical protein
MHLRVIMTSPWELLAWRRARLVALGIVGQVHRARLRLI